MQFNYLGKKTNAPSKQLDTFPTPKNVTAVKFESDELTSFCPVTQQPDFNRIVIEFAPRNLCVESKSLKLYLWSFRNEAKFAETLAGEMAALFSRSGLKSRLFKAFAVECSCRR